MKLYFLIIFFFIVYECSVRAQVGINTTAPQGVFHVDPMGNTLGVTNVGDDFIVTDAGRLGIGTLSPTASLDVIGNLRISDGTESNLNIMVSDASGLGSWVRQSYTSRVVGTVPPTLATIVSKGSIANVSDWTYSGANITLPAGSWMIYFYCVYNNIPSRDFIFWWDLTTASVWSNATRVGRVLSYFAPTHGLSTTYASFGVVASGTTTYYIHGAIAYPELNGYSFTYNSGARIWAIPVF